MACNSGKQTLHHLSSPLNGSDKTLNWEIQNPPPPPPPPTMGGWFLSSGLSEYFLIEADRVLAPSDAIFKGVDGKNDEGVWHSIGRGRSGVDIKWNF